MHAYYSIYYIYYTYIIFILILKYIDFTYTKTYVMIKTITLKSSIYKVHVRDVSNVHVYSTKLLNI